MGRPWVSEAASVEHDTDAMTVRLRSGRRVAGADILNTLPETASSGRAAWLERPKEALATLAVGAVDITTDTPRGSGPRGAA
jgi:hypothetical protein